MSEEYKKFSELKVDTSFIGLAREENQQYFCTPIGTTIIGWDNGIHYCFINGFGEMVFTVNPDSCCEYYVYPLALNFPDFLSLVLSAKGTNALQQIICWNKQQYSDFINSSQEIEYSLKSEVISSIIGIQSLGIIPMKQPFEYVKSIQKDFNYDLIPFMDEYYDMTGKEKP